jgi:hypothetical protein
MIQWSAAYATADRFASWTTSWDWLRGAGRPGSVVTTAANSWSHRLSIWRRSRVSARQSAHAKPAQVRGREARLKADFAYLYPGLDSSDWTPVETLINRVVTLLYGDPANSGRITGARLLREDHFEFRGASPRPEGWPAGLTRMSDAASPPDRG